MYPKKHTASCWLPALAKHLVLWCTVGGFEYFIETIMEGTISGCAFSGESNLAISG